MAMYGDGWCIAVHDFAQLHVLDRPPLSGRHCHGEPLGDPRTAICSSQVVPKPTPETEKDVNGGVQKGW